MPDTAENMSNELLLELMKSMHQRFDRLEQRVDDLTSVTRGISAQVAAFMQAIRAERRLDLHE